MYLCSIYHAAFPTSVWHGPPHTEQNSKEIPLSCCFTRWTSIIVVEFPPRHRFSLTHPSIHPSIRSVSATQPEQKQRNSLFCCDDFIYIEEGWNTRMKNLARLHLAPRWHAVQTFMMQHFDCFYIFYDLKSLLMSDTHTVQLQSDRRDMCTWTCINKAVIVTIIQMDCCVFLTQVK